MGTLGCPIAVRCTRDLDQAPGRRAPWTWRPSAAAHIQTNFVPVCSTLCSAARIQDRTAGTSRRGSSLLGRETTAR